jgi:hypothetical protein
MFHACLTGLHTHVFDFYPAGSGDEGHDEIRAGLGRMACGLQQWQRIMTTRG